MQGGRRDLSRSDVEDRTYSTGSSCSTILEKAEERERERESRKAESESGVFEFLVRSFAIGAGTYILRAIAIARRGG